MVAANKMNKALRAVLFVVHKVYATRFKAAKLKCDHFIAHIKDGSGS